VLDVLEAADGDGDTALTWATFCGRCAVMDSLLVHVGSDASFCHKINAQQFHAIKWKVSKISRVRQHNNPNPANTRLDVEGLRSFLFVRLHVSTPKGVEYVWASSNIFRVIEYRSTEKPALRRLSTS
jgi:hypothetical protein